MVYIFTECVNCPEICVNSLKSFFHYHNAPVHVFLCKKDKEYFNKHFTHDLIKYVFCDDCIMDIYQTSGHLGTAMIWANVILQNKNQKIVHFDSDTIFRGNMVEDILAKLKEGFDLVGPIRCYKYNLNNRDDIRHHPDVVSTYCFGFNPHLIDLFPFQILIRMCRGFYNPLGWKVLDFFDPVSFNILKNGGKPFFFDFNIIGGLNEKGDKLNNYKDLNVLIGDVGDKIIHFSSVGSEINFKKAAKQNKSTTVPISYVKNSLRTLACYNFFLFGKHSDLLQELYNDEYKRYKLHHNYFKELVDIEFIPLPDL